MQIILYNQFLLGVEPVLEQLKKDGLRLGVISNIDPRLEGILQQAGIRHYFEFALSSYEAGCAKPDSKIFQIALEKYSKQATDPTECCHVGDTFKTDCIGATQAGWNAVLVNELPNIFVKENLIKNVTQCKDISELHSHIVRL